MKPVCAANCRCSSCTERQYLLTDQATPLPSTWAGYGRSLQHGDAIKQKISASLFSFLLVKSAGGALAVASCNVALYRKSSVQM